MPRAWLLSTFLAAMFAATTPIAHAEEKEKMPELTAMQHYVVNQGGTEKPFQNEFWDNHAEGIYVDLKTGDPLFSSTDKFDSGTGWPSFTQSIDDNLQHREDHAFGMSRVEIRSPDGGSHLGHVFDDGPKEKGGKRYCINSAALRFIPKDQLTARYEKYKVLFDKTDKPNGQK